MPAILASRRSAAAILSTVLAAGGLAAVIALPAAADPSTQVQIHDIQGTSWVSPYAGSAVTNVPGIVTTVRTKGSSKGFWFQDPDPDDNPATSEGLFVYTGSTPTV